MYDSGQCLSSDDVMVEVCVKVRCMCDGVSFWSRCILWFLFGGVVVYGSNGSIRNSNGVRRSSHQAAWFSLGCSRIASCTGIRTFASLFPGVLVVVLR